MGLDLLFAAWLIIAGLLGFRDGSVRKLTSLVMTGVALFVGHIFMRDVGNVFVELLDAGPSSGPMLGFLAIFISIVLVQAIVYKLATDAFKIGGLADRTAGAILGVFQGILFLSAVLYIFSFSGIPSKSTRQYSKIYRSVVNVAPQLLDLFTTVQSASYEDIEQMARETGEKGLKKIVRSGEQAADSVSSNRLLREVRKRTATANDAIDSLRTNPR